MEYRVDESILVKLHVDLCALLTQVKLDANFSAVRTLPNISPVVAPGSQPDATGNFRCEERSATQDGLRVGFNCAD